MDLSLRLRVNMTPEEYDNLKPGDIVDYSRVSLTLVPPVTTGDGAVIKSTEVLVLAKGDSWQENSILVEVPTGNLISEHYFNLYHLENPSILGKRAWWFHYQNVYVVTKTADIKMIGGNCTICNEFNKWQSGPYQCWKHSH